MNSCVRVARFVKQFQGNTGRQSVRSKVCLPCITVHLLKDEVWLLCLRHQLTFTLTPHTSLVTSYARLLADMQHVLNQSHASHDLALYCRGSLGRFCSDRNPRIFLANA